MIREDLAETIGPALFEALRKRGFDALTPVQEAVILEDATAHDLRISSQTGSGKTVAIGLALRGFLTEATPAKSGTARPRAIVVTPTRELAKQVQEELSWLLGALNVRVVSVTGGAGYRDELRSFNTGPAVIVGTPGRLLDHLQRGSIDSSEVAAAVLDEADRMLDLGFREDIESILATLPEVHRTHLMSATFPRDVRMLADRVQTDVVSVEGTPIGRANADIEHVIHLVHFQQKFDAIVNLLLENPGAQTLIFARTRADVASLTKRLSETGFSMDSLSGEMEQRERNNALAAFKRGGLDALVATDVAARGIDVVDIARVIHADAPDDADSYTHRSGRTGRAGRKGKSSVLVAPGALPRASMLLRRAGVTFTIAPIPNANLIREREDENLANELVAESSALPEPDGRARAIAKKLLHADAAETAVARLVMRVRGKRPEPRDIAAVELRGGDRRATRDDYGAPRDGARDGMRDGPREGMRERGPRRQQNPDARFVSFRVSWGNVHGAEVRRVLAMACRRGGIGSESVGSIKVLPTYSIVDVAEGAADSFATRVSEPDPRDPRVTFQRDNAAATRERPRTYPGSQERAPRDFGGPRENAAPREQVIPRDRTSSRSVAPPRESRPDVAEHAPREAREHAPKEHAPREAREHAPKEHAPREAKEHAPREHAPHKYVTRDRAHKPRVAPKPHRKGGSNGGGGGSGGAGNGGGGGASSGGKGGHAPPKHAKRR